MYSKLHSLWTIITVLLLVAMNIDPAFGAPVKDLDSMTRARVCNFFCSLPLNFEMNGGQADARFAYLSRQPGYSLFLARDEAVLVLNPTSHRQKQQYPDTGHNIRGPMSLQVLRVQIVDVNANVQVRGIEELSGKSNYFIGKDPGKWLTEVPNYARVLYKDVYDGIDLMYYGNQGRLEYDFVVAPSADPGNIRLKFIGTDHLEVGPRGDLVLHAADRKVCFQNPSVYQKVGNSRHMIPGHYVLKGKNEVGFQVAAYDPTRPLVIDPVLAYSTYLGGGDTDQGNDIAVDASGNAYITGTTLSFNFPTQSSLYDTIGGGSDAFVTKLNATGSALIYSTYLGGGNIDDGYGIAVDGAGNAYIAGTTASFNFPTQNALDDTLDGNSDAFVTKLNATGSALIYSTYLGGGNSEQGNRIAVDALGNAYVTGTTFSGNFPTQNPLDDTIGGGSDAFVTKLNAAGSALTYSTYLGGGNSEEGNGIAVDTAGSSYVTGTTFSADFPTQNALDDTIGGGSDAFVTKLNAAGSALTYSTYLGGGNSEEGNGIAVDTAGNSYVTGTTFSADFPTQNPLDDTLDGNSDAFVTKLNAAGSALTYSTYLGGGNIDQGNSIAVDPHGSPPYITGRTLSVDFPSENAFQPNLDSGLDAFVAKIVDEAPEEGNGQGDGAEGGNGEDDDDDNGGNCFITAAGRGCRLTSMFK